MSDKDLLIIGGIGAAVLVAGFFIYSTSTGVNSGFTDTGEGLGDGLNSGLSSAGTGIGVGAAGLGIGGGLALLALVLL